MDNHVVILDTCQYVRKDNGTCILSGWMFVDEEREEPYVQARAQHTPVECFMTRTKRPDVLEARKDLPFTKEEVGFEIRIPNMEQIFYVADCLRVRICCGEESFPVLQKDMEQVRKEYFEDTIKYHVELLEKRLQKLHLQGWCVNSCGELEIKVLDDEGLPVQGVHYGRVRRPDVSEQMEVDISQCHGFILEIPREKIHAKTLHVVMKNPYASKEILIPMKKFDRENTRFGRVCRILGKDNKEKNIEIIKREGMSGFLDYIKEESGTFTDTYGYYEKKHRVSVKELKRQAKESFSPMPLFSIVVPMYRTSEVFLCALLDSVTGQSYQNWELCLADGSPDDSLGKIIAQKYGADKRIRYRHLENNTGIAGNTNEAISMANGDFIVFADHDDVLALDAVYEVASVIRSHSDAEFIYSDEDLIDEYGNCVYPHFKPDFNLDLLRCVNYICHLAVVKKSLLDKVGMLRPEFDGAQDFDFVLRCVEQTKTVYHIPKVLYHWRSHEESTAGNQESKQYAIDAGKHALEEHYARVGIEAEAEFTGMFIVYRTKFKIHGTPRVSILIPNKDHIEDLDTCIRSIQEKSTWKNIEIIVIENNSEQENTFAYYDKLKKQYDNVKIVTYEGGFNYSAINNFGAQAATGEYLLLLNNDTEVINPDWLECMLGYCQREDVGIVGAKLFYPDDTVQHAGVVIGIGGFAGHILTGYGKNDTGYMGRLQIAQDISAVTGACLMVKRQIFDTLGGLDEGFAVALNDVDFCLRVRELNKLVVFQPDAKLYHYESKSRGFETTPEKQERFQKEIARFKKRYKNILTSGDPYYNPNLCLMRGDCSLRKAHESVKGSNKS